MKEIAESKAANTTPSPTSSSEQVLTTKLNQEKLEQAISQLTTDILQLENVDDENVVDILQLIIEDHGDLPILIDLKGQYEIKLETVKPLKS